MYLPWTNNGAQSFYLFEAEHIHSIYTQKFFFSERPADLNKKTRYREIPKSWT